MVFMAMMIIGSLTACDVDNAEGSTSTELDFDIITDSLRKTGYDSIEITASRPEFAAPVLLYAGALGSEEAVATLVLPDSVGKDYQIKVSAFKSGEPGLEFSKTYSIAGGIVIGSSITVVQGTGPLDPDRPPLVVIDSPRDGALFSATPVTVAYKVNNIPMIRTVDVQEGPYTISVDTVINGVKGSASVEITLDTKAPVVAITSPAAGSKVESNPVAVAWTVDGISQSGLRMETMSAGDGEKVLVRTSSDLAGNVGSVTIKVILDKDKPQPPRMDAAGTTASPANSDSITWRWSPGGNGNGKYRYWLDNPALPSDTVPVSEGRAKVPNLGEGPHVLHVQEEDDQGNWSAAASHAVVVDRSGPAIAIDSGPRIVTDPAFTLGASVNDVPSGVASVEVSGAASGNGVMLPSAGKYARAVGLAEGANTLTVTAKDNLGNSRAATVAITFSRPVVTILWPPDGYVTSNSALAVQYKVSTDTAVKTRIHGFQSEGLNIVSVQEPHAAIASLQVYYLPTVVFVRKQAAGRRDGTSWEDAYNEVRTALKSPGGVKAGNRLWVSAGTYTGEALPGGNAFTLPNGVSLFGGFPPAGLPHSLGSRTLNTFPTQLSDSAQTKVLMRVEGGGTSIIDGFTLRMNSGEAVLQASNASLTLRNCRLQSDNATSGVMASDSSNLILDWFFITESSFSGPILSLAGSQIAVRNSSILDNFTPRVLALENAGASITESTIRLNRDDHGLISDISVDGGSTLSVSGNTTDMEQFR